MTGTDHYLEAERLIEHADAMLNADVHPQDRAELVARQSVIVAMASAHATLADAAVTGLSAHLDPPTHKPGAAPPALESRAQAAAVPGVVDLAFRARSRQLRAPAGSAQGDRRPLRGWTGIIGPWPAGRRAAWPRLTFARRSPPDAPEAAMLGARGEQSRRMARKAA